MTSRPNTYPQTNQIASPLTTYAEFLPCPACGHQIPLTTEGQTWTVRSPSDVAERLMVRYGHKESEHLIVLSLDSKNTVRDEALVYIGNVSQALVRIAELMAPPIRNHAAGLILVHSHPSGDPTPSPDDLHLTATVLAAARLMDLDLLDHIVVATSSFVSLRDRGIAFSR